MLNEFVFFLLQGLGTLCKYHQRWRRGLRCSRWYSGIYLKKIKRGRCVADFSLFAGLNFIILRIRPLVIYVRPHLEFAVQAWSPWQRGEVDLLEAVHMRTGSENWVWRPLNNVDWTRIWSKHTRSWKVLTTWTNQLGSSKHQRTRATEVERWNSLPQTAK